MKTPKYTPGPWTAVYTPSMNAPGIRIIDRVNELEIRYCNYSEVERPEADARLIAACPEMYEALKIAVKCLKETGGHTERFESLLAKIEGGSNE